MSPRGGRRGDERRECRYARPMRRATTVIRLLAGLLFFDLLLNGAGFDPGSVVSTLLRPSLDLLVVAAALLVAAQADARPASGARAGADARSGSGAGHRVIRGIVCLFVAGIALHTLGRRFGLAAVVMPFGSAGAAAAAGWALVVVGAAILVGLAWVAGGLVVRGFATVAVRSVFLLAIAMMAVVHVLAGNRVFAPSELPRIVREIVGLFR